LRRDQRANFSFIQPVTLAVRQRQAPEHLLLYRCGREHLVDALSRETKLLSDLVQGYALGPQFKRAPAHFAVHGRAMARSYAAATTRTLNMCHFPLSFLLYWHVAPLRESCVKLTPHDITSLNRKSWPQSVPWPFSRSAVASCAQ